MNSADYMLLLDYVLACPIMQTKSGLSQVCKLLPDYIRLEVKFSTTTSSQREDVAALGEACRQTRNGVAELIERISFFDAGTIQFYELQNFLQLLTEKNQSLSRVANPYRGLEVFLPEHRHFFFGRERVVAELVDKIDKRPFLAIIGNSGSGKSSLVFAGLIPQLADKGWQYLDFRPGLRSTPLCSLALILAKLHFPAKEEVDLRLEKAVLWREKLASKSLMVEGLLAERPLNGKKPLLLVVDQFEELFTACKDEAEQRQFLECLLAAFSPAAVERHRCRLVLTLRSDFFGNALTYRELADMLNSPDADFKLGPLSNEADLKEIIEKPADLEGVRFADGLVDVLLRDVGERPGDLPLLEFALSELWNKRSLSGEITHQAYKELGGVEQALAKHANGVYSRFSEAEQGRLHYVFTQLVQPGEGTEDTRRVANRSELGEENWELVVKLATERLVVTSSRDTFGKIGGNTASNENKRAAGQSIQEATVELTHETLIRRWELLQVWMRADREFRGWQERLRSSMVQWEAKQKDPEMLLPRRLVEEAEEWLKTQNNHLAPGEIAYIRESRKRLDKITRAERKKRRILRASIVITISALTILAAVAIFGFISANNQAIEVRQKLRTNQSLQLANFSKEQLDQSPDLALLLATQAFSFDPTLQAGIVLRDNLNGLTGIRKYLRGHSSYVAGVIFSGDGKYLASVSLDSTTILWDIASGKPIRSFKGYIDDLHNVAFSADGKQLATVSWDKTVVLWDVASGLPSRMLNGQLDGVRSVAFSADGKQLASVSLDSTIRLWDTTNGTLLNTFKGRSSYVAGVVFSPDGKQLAAGSWDNTIMVWDVASNNPLYTLKGHSSYVSSLAFSPDGKQLASGSNDKTIILWDIASGSVLKTLKGHSDGVNGIVFSPEATQIASGSTDKTIILWDIASGSALRTLKGHSDGVSSLAFSPDGKQLASGSADTTVMVWDIGSPLWSLKNHSYYVSSLAFSPDGKQIASSSWDKTVMIWDVASTKPVQTLKGHVYYVNTVAFSPNGKQLASGSWDETVIVWNATDNVPLDILKGHSSQVNSVAFSPNGKLLASGANDKTIILWDIASGNALRTLKGHSDGVRSVVFSPDGKQLASGAKDKTIILWDTASGNMLGILKGHTDGINSVAFSPNGKQLASGSWDKTTILWDVASGKPIRSFKSHSYGIASVAFSPDGKQLATGSWDKTVALWDITGSNPLYIFRGHTDGVNSVAFSPDGKQIASSSDDNSLILWDVDIKLLQEKTCKIVGRNLTWWEWERFVGPTEPYHKTCSDYPLPADLRENTADKPNSGFSTASSP